MQERYIGYRDPISSFLANKKYSGIISANVYRGFDRMTGINGLAFLMAHDLTGELFVNQDGTISTPLGAWVTRQGVVVKESESIPLTLETNAGNNSRRVDLLIGRHLHDILQPGGISAAYQIVKGPLGSDAEPNITDPQEAVVLGKFILEPNASSIANVTYIRNRAPSLGGKIPALLGEENVYTNQQSLYQSPTTLQSVSLDYEVAARGVIQGIDGANLFLVDTTFATLDLLPNKPNGTIIHLRFKGTIKIRGFVNNLVGDKLGIGERVGYSSGMRAISLINDLAELEVEAGQIVSLQKINIGGNFSSAQGNFEYGDMWKVISVSSNPLKLQSTERALVAATQEIVTLGLEIETLRGLINNINPPRLIQDIDYIGDLPTDFDATGKAKSTSPYYGRAICNGQNGTPDYRGRFRVSYSDLEVDYNSVGFIGGSKFVTLTVGQMPRHSHTVNIALCRNRGSSSAGDNLARQNDNDAFWNRGYTTDQQGNNESHENRPPYKVALTLMWIGVGEFGLLL